MKEEIKIPVGVSNRHVHLTKQNIELVKVGMRKPNHGYNRENG